MVKLLVRITAASVTPLDHTILSGQYPKAKAPLVLGNEGAGAAGVWKWKSEGSTTKSSGRQWIPHCKFASWQRNMMEKARELFRTVLGKHQSAQQHGLFPKEWTEPR